MYTTIYKIAASISYAQKISRILLYSGCYRHCIVVIIISKGARLRSPRIVSFISEQKLAYLLIQLLYVLIQ